MLEVNALTAEQWALFRLTLVSGLGPARLQALLATFGSAQAILSAAASELSQVLTIGPKLAKAILATDLAARANRLRDQMLQLQVGLLFADSIHYPNHLSQIPQPPQMLSIRGQLLPEDQFAIAIVGSRQCSTYGETMAWELSFALARAGFTIVSGLARGIDGFAHRAALEAGGRTIAVLASGLGNIYPPEHTALADQISRHGALLTEAPLDGKPIGGLFPQRNRIISGLSIGVIIVEGSLKSGALSTAFHALEQNREVFAVPGRVGDSTAEGTNKLIRDGAILVRDAADVLEQLPNHYRPDSRGPTGPTVPVTQVPSAAQIMRTPTGASPQPGTANLASIGTTSKEPTSSIMPETIAAPVMPSDLTDLEQALWRCLQTARTEGLDPDSLAEQLDQPASQVNTTLLLLEIRGILERLPGNRYRLRLN